MKLTHVLFKQHIGRYFRQHWQVQGKQKIYETNAFKALAAKNIPIYDANDIANEQRIIEPVEVLGMGPAPQAMDKTHPNWHDRYCLTYKDNNVLLEGVKQAQRLVKSVEIHEGLPESYVLKSSSKELDNRVKNIIMYSHILDAEQHKLPKRKDPLRPMFNYRRDLGVSFGRRMKLMTSKLLQLIEIMAGPQLSNTRALFDDVHFKFPFEKDGHLIQFDLSADTIMNTSISLQMITENQGVDVQFPTLHPIDDTITLVPENIYEFTNLYPFAKSMDKRHPHTLFVHYNTLNVGNIYGEAVTEDQFLGRSLLKSFTAAASYARQEFGDKINQLPRPVVLQCVHTDGKRFHFSVFQLNTLNLDNHDGVRNIWFQAPTMEMFENCAYIGGKPTLTGYNNNVIKHLICFYNSV